MTGHHSLSGGTGDRYRLLFHAASDIMLLADTDGRIVEANERAVASYGWPRSELLGRPLADLRTPQARCRIPNDLAQLRAAGTLTFETEHQTADDRCFPVEVSARLIDDAGSAWLLKIVRDISQRKAYEARIFDLAFFDPATRLANRDLFVDRLTQAIALAHRNGTPLMVLLVGFADLRRAASTAGMSGNGTVALSGAVAERLKACIPDADSVARVGGDEYAILLHADPSGADRVAAQILVRLAEPFAVNEHTISIDGDIGIASYPQDGRTAGELLQAAGVALLPALAEKGSEYRFHTPQLGRAARRRAELETHLRQALARDELALHYQPQVDAASGRVIAVEALMRWRHPEWGWVPPGEFIPVAEDCGLIAPLGDWALESAIAQVAAWHADGIDLRVAVNLSMLQLRDPALLDRLCGWLARHGVAADCLEIEITESMAVREVADTQTRLRAMADAGIHLAIDDFGTGYSSLARMKHLRIGLLKLDASFVSGLPDDAENAAIATAVIRMAEALGARTLAEGVETPAQFDWLRAHGCHLAQGWHFARAMPAQEIAHFCRERSSTAP